MVSQTPTLMFLSLSTKLLKNSNLLGNRDKDNEVDKFSNWIIKELDLTAIAVKNNKFGSLKESRANETDRPKKRSLFLFFSPLISFLYQLLLEQIELQIRCFFSYRQTPILKSFYLPSLNFCSKANLLCFYWVLICSAHVLPHHQFWDHMPRPNACISIKLLFAECMSY